MRMRHLLAAGLVCVALAPVLRADDKPANPSIVLRLKSVEGAMADLKYIAALVDKEDEVKNVEAIIQTFSNEKGLGGIDTKRPFALYGTFTPGVQDSPLVLLVPIADEKAFIDFLGNYNIKAEKDKDGVYTIDSIPGVPIPISAYFRVENKYAYLTVMDKANIDKSKLLAPEKVLPAAGDDALISIKLKLADMPDIVKQMLLTQIETKLADIKDQQKVPNETEAMRKLREKMVDQVGKQIAAALADGDELKLRVSLDSKKDDLSFGIDLAPKANSALAKDLKALSEAESVFAGLASDKAALSFVGHVVLPEELKKLLGPAVDDAIKQIIEKEKEDSKNLTKAALETLAPTLKSGEFDGGVAVFGPDKDGLHTLVAGTKLKEGKGIEDFGRNLLKLIPDKDKDKVKLDVDSIGELKIHKVHVGDSADANAKRIFGSSDVYLAVRNDAAFLAYGPDAQKALKDLISSSAKTAPILQLDVAAAKVATWDASNKDAGKVAKDIFGGAADGKDTVRVKVEAGSSLKITVTSKGKVLALGARVQK